MRKNKQQFGLFLLLTIGLIFFYGCVKSPQISAPNLLNVNTSFDEKINYSFELARYKLFQTINYLENNYKKPVAYPKVTENITLNSKNKKNLPNGYYSVGNAGYWSAGNFPSLIWLIYQQEQDLEIKKYWRKKAIFWSNPLRKKSSITAGDITINNLFVFRPWYKNSSGKERDQQLQIIFQGARALSQPLNIVDKSGRFEENTGTIGYFVKANKDKKMYWHAFMDHTINVEQLLWSAQNNPNQEEAKKWKNVAISHIKTLDKTMGENRNPGNSGTWQRGFFEINPNSSNFGKFLFNEHKQGWRDDTTWSRGQAWWIYSTSVAYKYTKDPEILTIAQSAINYYLNHLPDRFPGKLKREGDLIPPWDFDYALEVNPDTEKDTSAAAIAVSGMLKLVESLSPENPLKDKYLTASKQILEQLMSPKYLATPNQGMGILLHGCYIHYVVAPNAKIYDNSLIWGDYFFIDALTTYRNLQKINHE